MSNAVYPMLEGLGYNIKRSPGWATRMQRSVSGRTLRTADYINPIWVFGLQYEVLRDGNDTRFGIGQGTGFDELRLIEDFFNSRAGAFDSFFLDVPDDNTAIGEPMVAEPTDITGTMFHLARARQPGGFSEWITAPRNLTAVYDSGSLTTNYTIDGATGLVTFGTIPSSPSADFTYYFRVYFTDSLDFENFSYQLWELKQVKLTSVVAGL